MILQHKEITSKNMWDAFIFAHAPFALFQSWEWGEVEKKMGHTVWRWGWFNGDTLVGVAQIKKVTARRGTFLHVRHGPIGTVIFQDLFLLAKREHAWFVRISPQISDDRVYRKLGFTPAPIHAMDAEVCWVLDLDASEAELLSAMRKSTRYEIRKAEKSGVKITRGEEDFLELYKKTSLRQGFVGHSGIKEELEIFGKDARVYSAVHESKTLAAAIILFWGDEAIYHHGASIPNTFGASHLVQWEAIREAKKRGKKVYNFWGIAPQDRKNHPWTGLTVFKTGFGGREVSWVHAMDYPMSMFYTIPKTIETVRRMVKGY